MLALVVVVVWAVVVAGEHCHRQVWQQRWGWGWGWQGWRW